MNEHQKSMGNRTVKIVRNRERFWVDNVRPLGGVLVGEVNNNLVLYHPFNCGDTIELVEDEIIDISRGHMNEEDYPNDEARADGIKRVRKFYPLNQALPEARKLFIKTYNAEVKKQEQHEWDEEGDHCVKCNDPAWCASQKCANSSHS